MVEKVTLKGKAFNLRGDLMPEGAAAEDCELTDQELNPVRLFSFKGKSLLLISVPSLDTSVCSRETQHFNKELSRFKDWLNIVCVSMDLPFAQKRWCDASNVKNVHILSDYKNRQFGEKYGLLIPDLGLLARAVFLIDSDMKIKNVHLVKEISDEPDYSKILQQLEQMAPTSKK